jgi:DNA polymerase-3 subunit gamma/tau
MTYQVLARKWRPQAFDAVVGQDAVMRTLRNALASGRVAHAYLFTGPRGVGKTTTARLLAGALACTAREGPDACGKCPACRDFAAGAPVDVIEIDAASNSRVEEMRTIVENVRYAPARSRYKVYIVDEVHMLSGHAFNAFLKTLEEPPPHVVFILATTDPKKIPPTVLSRCQRFDFRPIPVETLLEHLGRILAEEGVVYEPGALPLLARAAEGSLRDALSLLDAAIAYGEGRVEEARVAELLGTSSPVHVRALVAALLARDAAAALEAVDRAAASGEDLDSLCRELIEAARGLLLLTVAPAAAGAVAPGLDEELRAAAAAAGVDGLLYVLRVLVEAQVEMRRSPHPRVELEIGVVRAARRPQVQAIEALITRLDEAERRLRTGAGVAAARPAAQASLLEPPAAPISARAPVAGGSARPSSIPSPPPRGRGQGEGAGAESPAVTASRAPRSDDAPVEPESPSTPLDLAQIWQRVVEEVMARKALLGSVLQQLTPVAVRDGALIVGLEGSKFHEDQLAQAANRELIHQVVQQLVPGARRIDVRNGAAAGSGASADPVVRAALAAGGEVVSVRPRAREEGESA